MKKKETQINKEFLSYWVNHMERESLSHVFESFAGEHAHEGFVYPNYVSWSMADNQEFRQLDLTAEQEQADSARNIHPLTYGAY